MLYFPPLCSWFCTEQPGSSPSRALFAAPSPSLLSSAPTVSSFLWGHPCRVTALCVYVSANQEELTGRLRHSWTSLERWGSEPDIKILEDQLDEAMVETSMKRKRYPRKILSHFVKALKTEREILNQYKPVVNAEKVRLDPALELRMKDLSATAATVCHHIHETKKDFESAFQENVSINGLSWHEAPDKDSEPDIKILEDQLDEAMVETSMKRKRYPRKILSHFVKALKTEREILNQYKPVVNAEKVRLDPALELRMKDLSATAATVCHHIHETKKEAPAQRKSFTLNFYTDMEIPALRCFYRLARAIGKPENESAAAGS
ncbi:uncharacterized protein [Aquarana catesbeiana]|uniref:uncharacterized protein isoform X3 n=1 Tax=Aquarana catesbeiana TaxID=8400 RepID=UPI003CC9EE11